MANETNLPQTSGSDMHDVHNIEKYLEDKSFIPGGVVFIERLKTIDDYVLGIKGKKHTILL